jgi:transketolase N-terminal domain/subunit
MSKEGLTERLEMVKDDIDKLKGDLESFRWDLDEIEGEVMSISDALEREDNHD